MMWSKSLFLILLQSLAIIAFYDPEIEIAKRVRHLRKICDKYKAETPNSILFEEHTDPSANYVQNWAQKFFVCVPAEVGGLVWNRLFRQLHNYDLKVN
jgi:hypothetical protein